MAKIINVIMDEEIKVENCSVVFFARSGLKKTEYRIITDAVWIARKCSRYKTSDFSTVIPRRKISIISLFLNKFISIRLNISNPIKDAE